jgi:uncharacterized protein (TIGR00251 family)
MALLTVKVVPGSRKDQVVGRYGDAMKVQVSAAPEGGRANAAVCEVLAASLGVAARQVRVVRGHTSPRKIVEIDGLSAEQVEAWRAKFQ